MNNKRIHIFILLFLFISLIAVGFLLPEERVIPVTGASSNDWNHQTFWFEPWGRSGVHKGIDIFGAMNSDVISTTAGLVIFIGEMGRGGNAVVVLGPKWRLHYFALLNQIDANFFQWVSKGEKIGSLGNSGNAKGKPPHLHYSIVRIFPAFSAADKATQGYKKMFFIDPHNSLMSAE